MPVLSLSKRPATKRLAGRFDRLRTGMARSYGCPAKSFRTCLDYIFQFETIS